MRRLKRKVQYKVWVQIEKWVGGEPIDSIDNQEFPLEVILPNRGVGDDMLVDSHELAVEIQDRLTSALVNGITEIDGL